MKHCYTQPRARVLLDHFSWNWNLNSALVTQSFRLFFTLHKSNMMHITPSQRCQCLRSILLIRLSESRELLEREALFFRRLRNQRLDLGEFLWGESEQLLQSSTPANVMWGRRSVLLHRPPLTVCVYGDVNRPHEPFSMTPSVRERERRQGFITSNAFHFAAFPFCVAAAPKEFFD